jgi:hypothetical protein
VATSRGTFLLGGAVLKLDEPLVVSLTVDGKWTMKSVPDNNAWALECKVGPADVLGTICPVTTKPSGPPIGVTESVLATSSCKRASLEDFSQQGNERFYKIHSYVQLRFRDRKFSGVSGLYMAADVDIVSYYKVLVPSPASQ